MESFRFKNMLCCQDCNMRTRVNTEFCRIKDESLIGIFKLSFSQSEGTHF